MSVRRRLRAFLQRPLLMADLTDRLADVYGDRVAVHLDHPLPSAAAAGDQLTYRDLHNLTARMASVLANSGVGEGTRVAVATANEFEFLLLCLAVMRLGAVAVPMNHLLTRHELLAIVAQSGAETLIADAGVYRQTFVSGSRPAAARVLIAGSWADAPEGTVSISDALAATPPPAPAARTQPDTVCAILYTSGTSGQPRGAIHTSGGLLCRMQLALLYPARRSELILVALPLAHIMGIVSVLLPLLAGAAIRFLGEFHPARVLRDIERHRVTMFVGVPAMYRMMHDVGIDGFDLSSIRAWISGADAMPPEVIEHFRQRGGVSAGRRRWPAVFVDVYGSVELGGAVMACVSMPFSTRPGGSRYGVLLPHCRARICDDDGRELSRGSIGELWIRCPSAFRGYVDDVSGDQLTRNGWVLTGDLAYRNRAGFVRFVQRKKDVIKSGGYTVFPADIERVLAAHEGVARAVAFAVPHPTRIQAPAAIVTLAAGASVGADALLAYTRTQLAEYKTPASIVVVEPHQIPYGPTHKIPRQELARRFGSRGRSTPRRHLDRDVPLTVVLGGGGIRGLAHLGVLEALSGAGFHITEIVGSSVGALVAAYYAGVGLDVRDMKAAGLSISTANLLAWALHRRLPQWIQRRSPLGSGVIPAYLGRLRSASPDRLHHGVARLGLVAKDLVSGEQVIWRSDCPLVPIDDIVRGAVAVPGVFPPRRCSAGGRELALIDGASLLPVEVVFGDGFQPRQVIAVDISRHPADRSRNASKVGRLRSQHASIPIEIISPDVIGQPTLVYRSTSLTHMIDAGRHAAEMALAEAAPTPAVGAGIGVS